MARTRITLPFSGAKLRTLRERGGLLQQDLSDRTAEAGHRISQEAISRYENGTQFPKPPSFLALVKGLGCDPDDLLDADQEGAA